MSKPTDRPGPHPENQRKRRELRGPRRTLIGMLAAVAVLGLPESFRAQPAGDAHALHVPLLLVIVTTQAIGCVLVAGHFAHARTVALAAALVALASGAGEIMVWDRVTWLQVALLAIGAFESFLVAGCTPRTAYSQA